MEGFFRQTNSHLMTNNSANGLETAQAILQQFICTDHANQSAAQVDNDSVRQALQQVVARSDYQIFGICADSTTQAAAALKDYLTALGYEDTPQVANMSGPVYVKYNPKTGRCHTELYTGTHRGVLVSCQSAYDGDVNATFGHLPLELFSDRSTVPDSANS